MLELRDLRVTYRAISALGGVSLAVAEGEIVTLVGANGAGKSSLLNAVSGVVPVAAGDILFEGESLRNRSPGDIVRRGVVQVPEGRQVYANLTVRENLELGAYVRDGARIGRKLDMVHDLFPRLLDRETQFAGLMSGGEQQMLAFGRALMAEPRLLLLDEPSMGLAPLVVNDIFRIMRRLNAELGITILLVEQNARAALALADRGYVLTSGRVSAQGGGRELMADPAVRDAFLGAAAPAPASASAGANP